MTVSHASVPALRNITFEIGEGEVVAVVGPNGAGKSTLLSTIMGLRTEVTGTINFEGQPLLGLSPDRIARGGIAFVPEGRQIFGDLTVWENLRLGMVGRSSPEGRDADLARALELFPIVGEFKDRQAGVLSGGQQQQLAIARALVANPRLLLLDEPSLGLAPAIIDTVFESLEQIRSEGRTILLVEQRAARAVEFADRSLVLANGEIRATLGPDDGDDTDTDALIAKAYFGA